MTREEQAFEASKRFEESLTEKDLATLSKDDMCFAFQLGVKWAESHPESPWISVEDNLPCNHKYLKDPRESFLKTTLVVVWDGVSAKMDYMYYEGMEWKWCHSKSVTHWMPVPEPPKE